MLGAVLTSGAMWLLGELGGTDEYSLVSALKDGECTRCMRRGVLIHAGCCVDEWCFAAVRGAGLHGRVLAGQRTQGG
jgi:hypothetical protein